MPTSYAPSATNNAVSVGGWSAEQSDLPRLELELVLSFVLDKPRTWLIAHPEAELTSAQVVRLDQCANALRDGQPLAYLTGQREFWGRAFKVTPATLIPRPETEHLVEIAIARAPKNARVLELGTGTGCIAITLAKERPDVSLVATDVSPDALAIAEHNATIHDAPVEFFLSDWFSEVSGRYEVIISNPPYVETGSADLPSLRQEPQLALVAGADGLDAIRQIVHAAPEYLDGWLLLEHGYTQGAAVRNLLEANGFAEVTTQVDLAGHDRVTIGHRP